MTVDTLRTRLTGLRIPTFQAINLWHWLVLVLVMFVVIAPVTLLVFGSFSGEKLPSDFTLDSLTIENYLDVWWESGIEGVLYNTVVYTTGATVLGITLAVSLAWMVERSNLPYKIWVYAGVILTLAMPGLLQSMAWVLLLSPRAGFINLQLMDLFGLESAPFNIYSLGGMIFIEGLRLVPTAFLMLVPLLRAMDPALEEAAATSGAHPASTLRKVTLKLMIPGLMAVVIYQAMSALETFEVPGILGMPAGIYVFSTKIYAILSSASGIPNYGEASALSMAYLVVAVAAIALYTRVISRSERYMIITGKGYRPRTLDLGVWRWPAFASVVAYLVLSVVLPLIVLIYISVIPYLQQPTAETLKTLTLDNYRFLFEADMVGIALKNTVIVTIAASTGTVLVSFFISLIVVRSKFWGRKLLDQLAFVPHAIPGIVMGLALLWLFIQIDKGGIHLAGSIWAITLGFIIAFMAYGTRAMNAAIMQIHKDLEEAAYVSGAVHWRTMWRIFFPLMIPTFVGVWVWTMLHAVRLTSLPLILYEGPQNQVLSVIIWNMWDEGNLGAVGAIGAPMVVALFIVTVGLRVIGFGDDRKIQKAGK